MGANSVIGLRIGEARLRDQADITSALAGCSACDSIQNAANAPVLNIAHCDVDVTITMSIQKNWNASSPWRKVWQRNMAYKTKGRPIGSLKKGITGAEFTPAVDQLKTWFQANAGVALDDAAADDILKQLYDQAKTKQSEIFSSIKHHFDSSTSDQLGYLPHAHDGFNETFRQLADTTDWDTGASITVRTVSTKVNIAIVPEISRFCKDDSGKGQIETKDSGFCGYFNVQWPDDNKWVVYINEYQDAPKGNVNSNYFTNDSWTQYNEAISAGAWQGSSIRNEIVQAALESNNNPGALYLVDGGFGGNINGFMKAAIVTDLSENPQTQMTATCSLAIGGGVGSDYYERPFLEGISAVLNLGSPGSIPGNVNGLVTFINRILNPPAPEYRTIGADMDNVDQVVPVTPDGTVGNPVPVIGGGSSQPSRIDDGTVSNGSNQGSTDIRSGGSQTNPTAPRPRSR